MKNYLDQIANARTPDEVNEIIDIAAYDESITNHEYCKIYESGVAKFYSLVCS